MNKEKKQEKKPEKPLDSPFVRATKQLVGDEVDGITGHAAKSGGFMVLRKNEKKEEEEEK